VKRREFIRLLGGSIAAWPLKSRAQQDQTRRVGALMSDAMSDPEARVRVAAFAQSLQELGWTDGRNVRIEYRWGAGDADRIRSFAAELVALAPNVCLASGTPAVAALQLMARARVPIVFVTVVDPVGAGFVESLARPGRNTTGFMLREFGVATKWLELLKESRRETNGGSSGPCHFRRRRAIGRNPSRCTHVGSGVEPS
jgi:putative ABC transport system substrate-binding protein